MVHLTPELIGIQKIVLIYIGIVFLYFLLIYNLKKGAALPHRPKDLGLRAINRMNLIIGFCVSWLMLAFITCSAPAVAANGVYIGTYTSPPYGRGEGIYYFLLDNGVVTSPVALANRTISPAINPSYLLTMQDQGSLYAVDEFFQINGPIASSGVTAYAINTSNNQLTTLNTQLTGLAAPVYLLADDSKKNLVIANYGDGSPNPTSGITVMPIQSDHSVAPYSQLIIYPSVPTVSHIHGLAKKTLDGVEYIFATDLGTSTLYAYTFDSTRPEPLQPFASVNGNPGQGLRHVVVSQDGKYLYVANEFDPAFPLTSSVSVYSFNPQVIPHLSLLTSLPAEHIQPGDLTANFPSELALNGNHLYVSNRGGNNIAEFNVSMTAPI